MFDLEQASYLINLISQGIQQNSISVNNRLLIVDDTLNMLNVMRAFVEDIGFDKVETASNGMENDISRR